VSQRLVQKFRRKPLFDYAARCQGLWAVRGHIVTWQITQLPVIKMKI
jgi:hypothetical protein